MSTFSPAAARAEPMEDWVGGQQTPNFLCIAGGGKPFSDADLCFTMHFSIMRPGGCVWGIPLSIPHLRTPGNVPCLIRVGVNLIK